MSLPISMGRFAVVWSIMAVALSVSGLGAAGLADAHERADILATLTPRSVMRRFHAIAAGVVAAAAIACASSPPSSAASPEAGPHGTMARVYYWRAKPGKLAEYTDYITKIAEPIDHEAQRRGAFISVTTFASRDTTTPWTHMRVFVLRDSAQLAGLSAALDAAGVSLEPDSMKRRQRSQYGATLRDPVGSGTYEIVP